MFIVRGRSYLATTAFCLTTLGIAGCSKQSSSSSTPTGPTPVVAVPGAVRLEATDIKARTARVSWDPASGATSYVVEVGTASGAADAARVTTGNPNTSLQLSELPPGRNLFVRVRAQQGGTTGEASAEFRFFMQDYKHLTEALMLQTGPYWPGGVLFDGVRGWAAGTHVRIRVSTTLTSEQRRGVEGVVSQLPQSGAPFTASLEYMDGNQAFARRDEIHVVTLANACGTGLGCASLYDTSLQNTGAQVFGYSAVFLGTAGERGDSADVAAHEVAHALLGLWHVHYQKIAEAPQFPSHFGKPDFPYLLMYSGAEPVFRMPLDRLSEVELQIVQDVFRSGISAGARRADLQARGLIY